MFETPHPFHHHLQVHQKKRPARSTGSGRVDRISQLELARAPLAGCADRADMAAIAAVVAVVREVLATVTLAIVVTGRAFAGSADAGHAVRTNLARDTTHVRIRAQAGSRVALAVAFGIRLFIAIATAVVGRHAVGIAIALASAAHIAELLSIRARRRIAPLHAFAGVVIAVIAHLADRLAPVATEFGLIWASAFAAFFVETDRTTRAAKWTAGFVVLRAETLAGLRIHHIGVQAGNRGALRIHRR